MSRTISDFFVRLESTTEYVLQWIEVKYNFGSLLSLHISGFFSCYSVSPVGHFLSPDCLRYIMGERGQGVHDETLHLCLHVYPVYLCIYKDMFIFCNEDGSRITTKLLMTNKQSIKFCLKATENGEPIS